MTNDPSMTITSTIPAPEGSDSTSREGKTIPLPVTAGSNAPPAQDAPPDIRSSCYPCSGSDNPR